MSDNPVSWLLLVLFVVFILLRMVHAALEELQDIKYEYYREERKK